MGGSALIATLVLAGMCVAMWWLARLAKKRMGIGAGTVSGAGLRVVGKRPLDQKSALYVIEIAGGRHILVGSSVEGSVTKIDDISPEEFEAMSADEPKAPSKLRLRVAAPDAEGNDEDAEDSNDLAAAPTAASFASVGESFSHFMNKAKDARANRAARRDTPNNKRASGE